MSRSQGALKDSESLVGVSFIDNNRSLVPESSPSRVFAPGDDVGAAGAPPSEIDGPNSAAVSDDNGDWSSSLGKKLTNYEGSPSGLQFPHENRISFPVSPSSHIVEDLGSSGALYSEVAPSNGNGDWVSSFGKSVGEVIFCIFLFGYCCGIYMISMFYYPESCLGSRQIPWGLIWTHLMIFFLGVPQATVSKAFEPCSTASIFSHLFLRMRVLSG